MLKDTSAMILAAGKGERMRPLTDNCPKPLISVAGRTMLHRAHDHVRRAGIESCVVNAHYLGEQVREAAQDFAKISSEEILLDTAGGVLNALPHLKSDPFFVLNGDVVWVDPSESFLKAMRAMWIPQMRSLIMLVPKENAKGYEGRGDFFRAEDGALRRPLKGESAPYIYGGVQLVSKSVFEGHAVKSFSFNVIWDELIPERQLYGAVFGGAWFHIGTPQALSNFEPEIEALESKVDGKTV